MSLNRNLNLLLKEIQDPYAQENFYRLKMYLENELGSGSLTQIVNNIISGSSVDAVNATRLKITRKAQEAIFAQELVRAYSSTHVSLATADSTSDEATVLGIADNDAVIGADVSVILLGVVSNAAFSAFTVNDPLFLDVDGGITNVKRTSGFHVNIGKSVGGNDILFQATAPITIA